MDVALSAYTSVQSLRNAVKGEGMSGKGYGRNLPKNYLMEEIFTNGKNGKEHGENRSQKTLHENSYKSSLSD